MKKSTLFLLGSALFIMWSLPALAAPQNAPLFKSPGYTCQAGATEVHDPQFGFVSMKRTETGYISADIFLQGASPNSVYDIWINQTPGTCPADEPSVSQGLQTDENGSGTAHVQDLAVAGAENFWISVTKEGEVYRSTSLQLP